MTLAASSTTTVAAIGTGLGVIVTAFWVWLVIISIRFLRWGRKAFQRYVDITPAPQQRTYGPQR